MTNQLTTPGTTFLPVEAFGVKKRFGDNEILRGVNLSVDKGEVLVLMGPSGSGKTTLIRCLNGLEVPDAGNLRVCGIDFGPDTSRSRAGRRKIRDVCCRTGMVFQQFNLFPHMTALENVIEGLVTVKRTPRHEAVARGEALLAKVGLADKLQEYPGRLSGGQRQRVAIARTLAMDPEVVFFDEPTSALDPELHEEVLCTMRDLAEEGMTMVVVTHEVQFARDVADTVVFLDGGVVLGRSSSEEFFTQQDDVRIRKFLRLVEG